VRSHLRSPTVLGLLLLANVTFGQSMLADIDSDGLADSEFGTLEMPPVCADAPTHFVGIDDRILVDLWVDTESAAFTGWTGGASWSGTMSLVPGSAGVLLTGCGGGNFVGCGGPLTSIRFLAMACDPPIEGVLPIARLRLVAGPEGQIGCVQPACQNFFFSAEETTLVESTALGRVEFSNRTGVAGPPFRVESNWGAVKGLFR